MTKISDVSSQEYVLQQQNVQNNSDNNSIWAFVPNDKGAEEPLVTGNNSSDSAEQQTNESDNEIKSKIKELLKDNNFDFESDEGKIMLDNVVKKYTALQTLKPDVFNDSEKLKNRLENYIKGYLYHQKENNFDLQGLAETTGDNLGFADDVIKNKDIKPNAYDKDYKNAFVKMSQEYIEFYDKNCDGLVEKQEIIAVQTEETERIYNRKLSSEEKGNIELMADAMLDALDNDKSNNKGGKSYIGQDEFVGYFWARNKGLKNEGNNDESDLTYDEYNKFTSALYDKVIYGSSEDYKRSCTNALNNHNLDIEILPSPSALQTFDETELSKYINTLREKGLSDSEINDVVNYLQALRAEMRNTAAKTAISNGYEGFKGI